MRTIHTQSVRIIALQTTQRVRIIALQTAFNYQELSSILARRRLEAIPANSEAKCCWHLLLLIRNFGRSRG